MSQDTPLRRILTTAALCATLALVGYSVVFYARLYARTPSDEDLRAAGAAIRAQWRKGDAVAVTPHWLLQGESALPGLPVVLTQHPEDESFADSGRLFVLSVQRRFDRGRDLMTARPGVTLDEQRQFGAVTVDRFVLAPGARVVFDFVDKLPRATVWMRTSGQEHPCPPAADGRFMCADNDWNYVGVADKFIGLARRRAIWAHPAPDELYIRFDSVPLGRTLVVKTAMTLFGATLPEGTPVFIDITVDGQSLGTATQPNSAEMHRHEFNLERFGDGPHDVQFVIHSDNCGRRHFVFQAHTM